MNLKNLLDLEDFAFQNQMYNPIYGEMCTFIVDQHHWF
jgi:hypothetical protein